MLSKLFSVAAGLLLAATFTAGAQGKAAAATFFEDYSLSITHWDALNEQEGGYLGQTVQVQLQLHDQPVRDTLASQFVFDMPGELDWDTFIDYVPSDLLPDGKSFWQKSYGNDRSIGVAQAIVYSDSPYVFFDAEMYACVGSSAGVGCGSLTVGAPEVAAVPVPPAIFLLGTGLLALLGFARKTSKKA